MSTEVGGASKSGGSGGAANAGKAGNSDGGTAEKFGKSVEKAKAAQASGATGRSSGSEPGSPANASTGPAAAADQGVGSATPSTAGSQTQAASSGRDMSAARVPSGASPEARAAYASKEADAARGHLTQSYNALAAATSTLQGASRADEKARAQAAHDTAYQQLKAATSLSRSAIGLKAATEAHNRAPSDATQAALDAAYKNYIGAKSAFGEQTLITKQKYASRSVDAAKGYDTRVSDIHERVARAAALNPTNQQLGAAKAITGKVDQAAARQVSAAGAMKSATSQYADAASKLASAEKALAARPNDQNLKANVDRAKTEKKAAADALDSKFKAYKDAQKNFDALKPTLAEAQKIIERQQVKAGVTLAKSTVTNASNIGSMAGEDTSIGKFARGNLGVAEATLRGLDGDEVGAATSGIKAATDLAEAATTGQKKAAASGIGNAASGVYSGIELNKNAQKVKGGDLNAIPALIGSVAGLASAGASVANATITGALVPAMTAAKTAATTQLATAKAAEQAAGRASYLQPSAKNSANLERAIKAREALETRIKSIETHLSNMDKAQKIISRGGDIADAVSLVTNGVTGSPTFGAGFANQPWAGFKEGFNVLNYVG